MKITADQIQALAEKLLDAAAMFDPKDAAMIRLLFEAGTELNTLLHDISNQTDETSQQVWNEVRGNYQASVKAFEESEPAATEAEQPPGA